MFTLFHFGFLIFKIALQSGIYSLIIFFVLTAIGRLTGNTHLNRLRFTAIYLATATLLFIFSFTYYGNHGLGDEAKLPLGHNKTMRSSDGYAYLDIGRKQVPVESFFVYNEHLCLASETGYYDYLLPTGDWVRYNSVQEYEAYASTHNLPLTYQFKTFYTYYDEYWNGWRFWLLP